MVEHQRAAGGPVGAIAGNGDVLVAGMLRGEGTYLSHDNGHTWDRIADFPPFTDVHHAAWSPHDPQLGFVSAYGGLARTTDGGDTWEHLFDNVTVTGPVAFHPDTGAIAVHHRPAGTWDLHVLVSHDNGDTWTDFGSPDTGLFFGELAFGPTADHVCALDRTVAWLTTEGGATWQEQSEGGLAVVQDADGTWWRSGSGALKRSTDHGLTWQAVSVPVDSNPQFVAARPGGGLYATTFDGILLTTDGGITWTNLGFAGATFGTTGLIVDPNDPDAIFIADENVGVVWIGPTEFGYALEGRANGFPPVPVKALGGGADGNLLLAAGQYGTYGSRDGGTTWAHLGPGMGMGSTRAAGASTDSQFVYAGGQTLFFQPWFAHSRDGGRTWEGLMINIGGDGYVSGIATHPTYPATAWVAVWGEVVASRLLETTDGGATWQTILETAAKVHDVAYHDGRGTLLVATSTGVQARSPLTGEWFVTSPGMGAAQAVASDQTHAYAVGAAPRAHRTVVSAAPLIGPWAVTEGAARDVAVDGTGGVRSDAARIRRVRRARATGRSGDVRRDHGIGPVVRGIVTGLVAGRVRAQRPCDGIAAGAAARLRTPTVTHPQCRPWQAPPRPTPAPPTTRQTSAPAPPTRVPPRPCRCAARS